MDRFLRLFRHERRHPQKQQKQRMIHLVFDAGFESGKLIGLQNRFERMRAECAEDDREYSENGGCGGDFSFHDFEFDPKVSQLF